MSDSAAWWLPSRRVVIRVSEALAFDLRDNHVPRFRRESGNADASYAELLLAWCDAFESSARSEDDLAKFHEIISAVAVNEAGTWVLYITREVRDRLMRVKLLLQTEAGAPVSYDDVIRFMSGFHQARQEAGAAGLEDIRFAVRYIDSVTGETVARREGVLLAEGPKAGQDIVFIGGFGTSEEGHVLRAHANTETGEIEVIVEMH